MLTSGIAAEKDWRATAAPDLHHLLTPLHLLASTPTLPEPREMKALEGIERIARLHDPVWITGEIGAGAVWVARALHEHSPQGGTFVRRDCDPTRPVMLPEGHGTLLLCSPERLSTEHQEALLAQLQRTDLRHLEGLRTVSPAPRVMAWSAAPLPTLVRTGRILPGLAQALGRVQITVPPLRSQREPIDYFARAILDQVAAEEGLPVRRLTSEALAALRSYAWPGNLTELHSLLERACLLVDPEQAELDVQDLPFTPTKSPDGPASQSFGSSSLTASREPRTMSEIEAEAIRIAIDGNAGNLVRAARELRIGRATLYRKLKKYGIPTRTQKRQLAR
jgi:two-component system nitrogen regulation response regulator NtrX